MNKQRLNLGAPINYRNLAIAAILFIVLLVIFFYWLIIFSTKNQDSTDKTQNITNMQGKVKYLLTIRYTDYVKEIDDTTRNCTKMNKDAEDFGSIIYLHFPASLL
nr:uncharacterized protein LOC117685039 [Crassostrea gigas]